MSTYFCMLDRPRLLLLSARHQDWSSLENQCWFRSIFWQFVPHWIYINILSPTKIQEASIYHYSKFRILSLGLYPILLESQFVDSRHVLRTMSTASTASTMSPLLTSSAGPWSTSVISPTWRPCQRGWKFAFHWLFQGLYVFGGRDICEKNLKDWNWVI